LPTINFVHPDGARQSVEAAIGSSVMRAAVTNGIEGILAECGGACACATCHVYIAPVPGLPKISTMEDDMLESTAAPRQPTSRLSCQIYVTAELDGLTVQLPETQV
jgi:2Fe-2S ferredoxin